MFTAVIGSLETGHSEIGDRGQVQNSTMDQAMKADLPTKAIQAIAGGSHTSMATKLLSEEATRDVFLTVVYELLKKDAGADLLSSARA